MWTKSTVSTFTLLESLKHGNMVPSVRRNGNAVASVQKR
jgi:hypothetical protein